MGSGIIFVVNLRISHNLPIYGIHVYNNNYIYILIVLININTYFNV